jgi:hypothetical protein
MDRHPDASREATRLTSHSPGATRMQQHEHHTEDESAR